MKTEEVNANPCLKYEIQKSDNLGLIMPESLELMIHQTLPQTNSPFPSYITNRMDWTDVLTALPPNIELAIPPDPVTASQGAQLQRLVSVIPRGVQGYTGFIVDLVTLQNGPSMSEKISTPSSPGKWTIKRSGISRSHKMTPNEMMAENSPGTELVWKGSTKVLGLVNDGTPNCKGNLKLETADGQNILAAWKQRRDSDILGSLTVFETAQQYMSVELIIASCICVVISERVSGMNWLGGLGKRK